MLVESIFNVKLCSNIQFQFSNICSFLNSFYLTQFGLFWCYLDPNQSSLKWIWERKSQLIRIRSGDLSGSGSDPSKCSGSGSRSATLLPPFHILLAFLSDILSFFLPSFSLLPFSQLHFCLPLYPIFPTLTSVFSISSFLVHICSITIFFPSIVPSSPFLN